MWNDRLRQHYWWAEINGEAEKLLYELRKAEDEEEAGAYLLQLYLKNEADLEFFTTEERAQIQKILSFLIQETEKHCSVLSNLADELEKKRIGHAE